MEHVVAADLARAVGQPVRMPVVGRREQELGRVGRPGRDDDDVGAVGLLDAVALDDDPLDGGAGRVRLEAGDDAPGSERDVVCSSAGRTPSTSASDLACTQAREAVAGPAADARAVRSGRPPAAGRRTGRGTGDSRPARGRRESCWMRGSWVSAGNGYWRAGVALGRVLAVVAVDLVQLLGLRVVRLHLVVGDRPGGRDPVVVAQLAEVLAAAAGRGPRRRAWWRRRPQ